MTWAEKEVPSLELCKRLKELGFPQEGEGWCWYTNKEILRWKVVYNKGFYPIEELYGEYIKAPTCREMIEWISKVEPHCIISYKSITPERLAKDLICLAKNKRVKFKRQKESHAFKDERN